MYTHASEGLENFEISWIIFFVVKLVYQSAGILTAGIFFEVIALLRKLLRKNRVCYFQGELYIQTLKHFRTNSASCLK